MRRNVIAAAICVLGIGFAAVSVAGHPSDVVHSRCCNHPRPEDIRSYHVQAIGDEGQGTVIESVEGHHGFVITSVIVAGGSTGDAILFQDGRPFLRVHTNDFLNFGSGIPLTTGTTITVQQSGLYGATISGYVYQPCPPASLNSAMVS